MAAQAALTKRGVAVLILPVDVSKADAPDEPPFAVHVSLPITRPSDADLDRIAEVLNGGKRIAIYGGSGCQGAHDQVVALANRLKAPVAHTSRAKDFVEYDNPFNVGMTGVLGAAGGYHAVMTCDTLLLLGCDFAWRQFYPDHARIVQIDIEPTHLGRRHPVEIGFVGDVKATLEALVPRLTPRTDRVDPVANCRVQPFRPGPSGHFAERLGQRTRRHQHHLAAQLGQRLEARRDRVRERFGRRGGFGHVDHCVLLRSRRTTSLSEESSR
jgi:thiamine pyrophosphate-dependent acetolactate synthase large subunit-like protein